MKIHRVIVHLIEEALEIKLHEDQIKYITGDILEPNYDGLRGTGKTTAYCIKLALSSGPPLDLRDSTKFSDAHHSGLTGGDADRYSKYYFSRMFATIREKLSKHGLPVRELIYPKRTIGGFIVGD